MELLVDYENRLIKNNRKYALELSAQYDKQRELENELEQRSTLITQLTNKLQREKQHQQNVRSRFQFGQVILPNKPVKLKINDEQQKISSSGRHLVNRSSFLSNRNSSDHELTKVLFIGRRPLIPHEQLQSFSSKIIESNGEQLYTKRQRQLLNHHTVNTDLNKVASSGSRTKLSTVLPPIVNRKIPLKALATRTLPRAGQI